MKRASRSDASAKAASPANTERPAERIEGVIATLFHTALWAHRLTLEGPPGTVESLVLDEAHRVRNVYRGNAKIRVESDVHDAPGDGHAEPGPSRARGRRARQANAEPTLFDLAQDPTGE